MNIVWVNHRDPRHPQAGGAEVHLREVATRLVKKGCQITLLSERFPGSKEEEMIDGIRVIRRGGRFGVHLKAPMLVHRLAKDADVVVDDIAHAVPWWSRFVTRTPVIGMVHHVHQSVATLELGIPVGTAVKLAERTIKTSYSRLITFSQGTKREIEKQPKCLNLDDVLFVSRVRDEERVRLLQKSWALCTPSLVEGWGLVITEAAACGTPTLAYDGGASNEAIVDGETGYLVRYGDVQALSEKIVMLNRDDELRRSMSNTAIQYSNRFDWDTTTNETMKILEASSN